MESLLKKQDTDLFIRVVIDGATPVLSKVSTYVYRNHENSARITRRRGRNVASSMLEMYKGHFELLKAMGNDHRREQISRGLAYSVWRTGRNVLRQGHVRIAREYFSLSKAFSSDPVVVGSLPYRWLCVLIGVGRAERLVVGGV